MPSAYAHYLFGEKVAAGLTGHLADIVKSNRQLYYIGLHGPDILFYYKPLKNNAINSQGYAIHERPSAEFFKRAADIWQLIADKDGAAAYLAGFVCHFALDHACHPYIEKKIEVSGLKHSEIENEFDRYLIFMSGKQLKHTDLTGHISATEYNAAIIAPFFENVTDVQVKKALKSMKFYNNFIIGNRAYKRFLVNFCLKISGTYGKMKGVMMAKKPVEGCTDSNRRLHKYFNKAADGCLELQKNFFAYLCGEEELDERFNYTFGAGDDWKDIPVLDAVKEDMYEV